MVELIKVLEAPYAEKLSGARTIGLDIGSRAAKGLLLYDGKLYCTITASGISSRETASKLVRILLDEAKIDVSNVQYLVGTGYGRIAIEQKEIPSQVITEISCHAMGAHYLNPDTRTILDIGGQDSKAIKIDSASGKVIEFVMNDKCAAGTGRFLEKVAQLLEVDLEELGVYAIRSKKPSEISSQCVVFAESEVVSLRAKGVSKEDIAAGIHLATARRVRNMLRRIGMDDTIIFTGGVSNNPGMRKAVSEILGKKLGNTKLDAAFAGALGAAIFASEYVTGKE